MTQLKVIIFLSTIIFLTTSVNADCVDNNRTEQGTGNIIDGTCMELPVEPYPDKYDCGSGMRLVQGTANTCIAGTEVSDPGIWLPSQLKCPPGETLVQGTVECRIDPSFDRWWEEMSIFIYSSAFTESNGVYQSGSEWSFALLNESSSATLKVEDLIVKNGNAGVVLEQVVDTDLNVGQGVGHTVTLGANQKVPLVFTYVVFDKSTEIRQNISIYTKNEYPIANAGADLTIQVNKSITITGSGIDNDGTIVSYEWKKGTAVIATTDTFIYTPTATGTDTLTLVVVDNNGAIASDTMTVTVTVSSPTQWDISNWDELIWQ